MKTTEQLASKFLRALEAAPKESNQWSAKSAQEIREGLKFSNEEFKSVIDYAFHGKLIEMTKKTDGFMRVRLGQNADGWMLDIAKANQKPKDGWRHKIIPPIIVGIVLLIVGAAFRYYFPQWFPK